MTQQAKKSANFQASPKSNFINQKKPQSAFEPMNSVQKAEKEALKMGRDSVEGMMRAADSINHTANECADICSENIGTLLESGNIASNMIRNFSQESMECCNRAFSDGTEIVNEALACRTLDDMVGLYDKVMQRTWNNYLDGANKLGGMMFWNFTRSDKHSAPASKQTHKAA